MCEKQCKMREINMQKTLRNAANLCAKNSAKCGKFKCKKHCEMRYFSANFPYIFCIWIWRIFQCFLQESLQEIIWQFSICFKLFRDDFYGTVCRDGTGGIPVKSRSGLHWKYSILQRDVNEKRDCESYATKTVKPSFEPQTTSLMLKMRLLKRSGQKYEKSWSFGHSVFWVLAKVVRWVWVFSQFFCKENCAKSRKTRAKMD